jgi:hypothetical protein
MTAVEKMQLLHRFATNDGIFCDLSASQRPPSA